MIINQTAFYQKENVYERKNNFRKISFPTKEREFLELDETLKFSHVYIQIPFKIF